MKPLRIATRGSRLARHQAELAARRLGDRPTEIVIVETTGDKDRSTALPEMGSVGLFTKEVERAVLDGRADLAVHSYKDLPTRMAEGLVLGALLPREDPRDALCLRMASSLDALPPGATIGTSSVRRRAFLRCLRPDLEVVNFRGNVPTRLEKLKEGEVDGIVLACAGLRRLGLEDAITQVLDTEPFLPAPAQGAIAIQVREADRERSWLSTVNDEGTWRVVEAERTVLAILEGGCHLPLGTLGVETKDGRIELEAALASTDGSRVVSARRVSGADESPEALGRRVAEELLAEGGKAILREFRAE